MNKKTRTVSRLVIASLAMFAFGFALVPIYDVVCEITGLNGKTGVTSDEMVSVNAPDLSRTVTVELISNLNQSMQMEFAPQQKKIDIYPGQSYEVSYIARNLTGERLVGQAYPSVSPAAAAAYLNKIECFCFSEQVFEPNQERKLPVRFVVSPKLPTHITTVSLSYTFFDITHKT